MKQHPFDCGQIGVLKKLRIDLCHVVGHAHDPRRTDQHVKRQGVDLARAFDEVRRRVDVRAGVRAEMQKRNVRRIAFPKRRPRGDVDAALVPVIEYQRLDGVSIVPDVCVGSRSAVRSVVLATKLNNLKKVKRVALDDSSRTSVALIKILFREFLGLEPEWVTSPPDLKSMLTHADAALIIGDPAMKIPRDQFQVFDLATLWHDYTGFA